MSGRDAVDALTQGAVQRVQQLGQRLLLIGLFSAQQQGQELVQSIRVLRKGMPASPRVQVHAAQIPHLPREGLSKHPSGRQAF